MNGKLMKAALMAVALMLPVKAFGLMKLEPYMSIYSADKGGLSTPEGVAYSAGLHAIVVADTGDGRLMKYAFEDGKVTSESEIKLSQIVYPIEVQVNSKGDIFALDGKQRRIVRISSDGKFEGYVDPSGMPDPDQFMPKSFTIDSNDNIYVLDIMDARVVVLGPDGKFMRQIDFPQDAGFISDVAVDESGEIILSDSARDLLYAPPRAPRPLPRLQAA